MKPSSILVEDSHIIFLDARGSKYLKFVNSTVDHSHYIIAVPGRKEETGRFSVEFDNSVCKEDMEIACEYVFFTGDVSFEMDLEGVNFQKGVLEREYPVVVLDHGNNPLPSVPMQLFDSDNKSVWSGIANEKGEVFPVITFDKSNYTQEWTLMSADAGFSKKLGLLTSTPVLIYPAARDLVVQLVGPNWIVIAVAAIAIVIITVMIVFVLRKKTKTRA